MGRVYLAKDQIQQRQVALKTLLSFRDAKALTEEFQILTRLSHPNLVGIYDFHQEATGLCEGTELSGPCFSMEFLHGSPLDQSHASITVELWPKILAKLLAGLNYLHTRGALHRDLKPGNIFLASNGEIKLLDFGLSGEAEETPSQAPMGTLAYLPPEAFWGKYETRSDLFSVGVLFYELLSGGPPYPLWPPQGKAALMPPKDLGGLRPDLPEFLCRAVHMLLAPSPTERPSSALALLQYLHHCGGNPLLLIESLRRGLADNFSGTSEATENFSEKISLSCRQRFLALSEQDSRLFILLLCRGNSVEMGELRELWAGDEDSFQTSLSNLERQGWLRRSAEFPQRREFTQTSLRDFYLETIPAKKLKNAHRLWLDYLLKKAPSIPLPDASALAIAEQALGAEDRPLAKSWGLRWLTMLRALGRFGARLAFCLVCPGEGSPRHRLVILQRDP